MLKASRDRSPTIRTLLEESEETGDDEEEKELKRPVKTMTISSDQTNDSVTVIVNPVRSRQHLVRRSSSAVGGLSIPVIKKDAGDKSLQPRFLQERSATLVHISPVAIDPLRIPRSKASAFLMDVLAKSKEFAVTETRPPSLEPLRHAPGGNTLQYFPIQGSEREPLRVARRYGHQVPSKPSSELLNEETATERRLSASQERITAIVRALKATKKQLHQQLDILQSILRLINANDRDHTGKRSVIKEMVDEGMIPELASIMREFRFSTSLQLCVMSILSALAEESPVYAYMMSEFNLEKLVQKTAAVHASQDQLIVLASTLVHVIEDSKHNVNIHAYLAEKAEKSRQQTENYTDMIVASIATKPKQPQLLSPSLSTKSATCRRPCQSETEATRSRISVKSAPPSSEKHQTFSLAVAPPTLSANYRLLFSQKLKNSEVQPVQVSKINRNAANYHAKRGRPASNPAKKSLHLEMTSRSRAAAIYSSGSIFVEPSPLAKRMPFRGSFSAGGVPRRLQVSKRDPRPQTERLLPTQIPANLSPPMSERADSETLDPETYNLPYTDHKLDGFSRNEEEKDDDDEESYEDDFDATDDDDTDEDTKMLNRRDSKSDGELIDILHSISLEDSGNSLTASMSEENDTGRIIGRQVREVVIRCDSSGLSNTTTSNKRVHPLEKQTLRMAKKEKRGSKSYRIKGNYTSRAHRQLRTEGFSTTRDDKIRQGATKFSLPGGNIVGERKNNQQISPQRKKFVEITTETEYKTEDTPIEKEPPEPEALKQIQDLYAEGLQHHKENHLGLAIECYEKALTLPGGQDFSSLHLNLGSALITQNKFLEALKSFEQAKRIQPTNIKAIYNNSLALIHLNRPQEAQRLLHHILELEPSYKNAIIALAHLQARIMAVQQSTPQYYCRK